MSSQRYTVLEKLDAGGMAEVWKGRSNSLKGFEKLVAIKRILPSLSENKRFMEMFLDEARLSLRLNHANIVQTFDIGVSDNTYFIVMEWIDGANLKTIIDIALEQGFRIPKEQAVFIMIEICKGLSHAHQRRDESGALLDIVHRDVSPPNILISREGEVKLVDFGLAKAKSQLSPTDPGMVKGKFGYLSPEGARGEVVDFRSDIFSAGTVLWEILAGRRLFAGRDNLETVQLVREARIPRLSELNSDVDPELESIIGKALAQDPDERFQSCEQLGHALSRYLFSNQLMVMSFDIAVLVKRILAERSLTRPMRVVSGDTLAGTKRVEGELGAFVSLEELEQMSFVSVSAAHPELPPDDASVDPRSWVDEFDLDGDGPSLAGSSTGEKTRLNTIPPQFLESIATESESHGQSDRGPQKPVEKPPAAKKRALLPSLEPRIQRVSRPADDLVEGGAESVSLIDFAAPTQIPRVQPAPQEEPTDNSLLYGIMGGLAGAAVIIAGSWYLFGG